MQKGMNLENVKMKNKSAIIGLLNSRGSMSRKDIADIIGLTPATVTLLCNEIMEEGLIREKGEMQEEKRAGRKKILVEINYACKCVVAVTINARNTYISICDLKANLLGGKKIVTQCDINPPLFLETIAKEAKALLWECKKSHEDILGMGIVVPGIVDRKRGISKLAYGIWKEEVSLRNLMEEYMSCTVIVENNIKAFAQGELLYGLGKKSSNMFFLRWGPGVGAAIIIGNELYEGKDNGAAEIGHYVVNPDGITCKCGRKGCLETIVSMQAMREKICAVFSETHTPVLFQQLGGDITKFTEDYFEQWIGDMKMASVEEMDEPIQDIFGNSMEVMAAAVLNVITILAPNETILFGSMFDNDSIEQAFLNYCRKNGMHIENHIQRSNLSKLIHHIGPTAIITKQMLFDTGSVNEIFIKGSLKQHYAASRFRT